MFRCSLTRIGGTEDENTDAAQNARKVIKQASETSRITRVLRVVRLVRLLRVIKLYKAAIQARANMEKSKKDRKKKKEQKQIRQELSTKLRRKQSINIGIEAFNLNKTLSIKETSNESQIKVPPESKISRILSESITKKLIIIIMVMSLVMPLLSEELYLSNDTTNYLILSKYVCQLNELYNGNMPPEILHPLSFFEKEVHASELILNITINDVVFYKNNTLSDSYLREKEIDFAVSTEGSCIVTFEKEELIVFEAIFSICNTLFACIVLIAAAYSFESITKNLVLDPLEVMKEIVDKVAEDPINAKNMEEMENGIKAFQMKMENGELGKGSKESNLEEKYEVIMIKRAILKISALLAIGFGEAGGQIIKENLSNNNELNPMMNGTRVNCIFGFCDIRRFDEIIKALQEKTILLVNNIALIVHSSVDTFGGNANKNIGDAFLCAWKIPKVKKVDDTNNDFKIKRLACQAVFGYLDIIAEVQTNEDIQNLIKQSSLNNFALRMGFGLHIGWAIEGAIGSRYKIDASYLSPNVNLSARLEAATKQYGVNFLLSGELYDYLAVELQNKTRLIDIVMVKGSNVPMRLYTIDVNLELQKELKEGKVKKEVNKGQNRKKSISKTFNDMGEFACFSILSDDKFEHLLDSKRPKLFYKTFKKAVSAYLNGNWKISKKLLTSCLEMFDDGPSNTLYNYMKELQFKAPKDWSGYRELLSK